MNYNTYKLTENDNGFYFYFISPFSESNIECTLESVEHYISNEETDMNKYLHTIDFDNVKIEKSNISPIDVLNKVFQPDDKNMLNSNSFVSHIPPPKEKKKRETKPKEPKKEPKPRSKKSSQKKIDISTENTTVVMN